MIEHSGRKNFAHLKQNIFRRLRGFLVRMVVITHALALAVIPVCNFMDGFINPRPEIEFHLALFRKFIEGHERFIAMQAEHSALADFTRHQRQQRRAAAGRFAIRSGRSGEAFVPNLAVVTDLCSEPIRAHERMRQSPRFVLKLAERLSKPTRHREIVEVLKGATVTFPKNIQRRIRIMSHRAEDGAQSPGCRACGIQTRNVLSHKKAQEAQNNKVVSNQLKSEQGYMRESHVETLVMKNQGYGLRSSIEMRVKLSGAKPIASFIW